MRPELMIALLTSGLLLSSGCDGDVGAACESDADCEVGTCYTKSSPGYCTAVCEEEGSTNDCPEDTVCKRIEGGEIRCILVCETMEDCPTNSDCNTVPNSDLKGCEPVH